MGYPTEDEIAGRHAVVVDRAPSVLDQYQKEAARTLRRAHPEHPEFRERFTHNVAVMGLGVAGEAGEVADYLKKVIGHGKAFDVDVLKKELGDVLWYIAALATMYGFTLEEVAAKNVTKLRERFPNGFTEADAEARRDVKR